MTDAHPLTIALPDGVCAHLIPGSRPPRYEVNGEPCAIDVTIPGDLAAAGWCWHGSFLYQPYPGRDDGPGVAIATCTFPPPGWPSAHRTCFDSAYTMERLRAEHDALCAARPAKAKRSKRPKPSAPPVEIIEQMELAL